MAEAILPMLEVFESRSRVRYFQGEEKVKEKWPGEILREPLGK